MRMRKIDRAIFENRNEVVINNRVMKVEDAYYGIKKDSNESEKKVVEKK